MRRLITVALAAAAFAFAGVAAPAAHADICYFYNPNTGQITYPCPGYNDQPVPTPVAVVFAIGGPGYHSPEYDFVKLKRGGTIYFVNNGIVPAEYWGDGFGSGLVPGGGVAVVGGVSSLDVGAYLVADDRNRAAGMLYIDP